jgi:hypothetical protein
LIIYPKPETMKLKCVSTSLGICLIWAMFMVSGCTNEPPNCSLTRPPDSSCYFNGDSILIKADAFDSDGSIAGVEFSLDGELIASLDAQPYEYKHVVKDLAHGDH